MLCHKNKCSRSTITLTSAVVRDLACAQKSRGAMLNEQRSHMATIQLCPRAHGSPYEHAQQAVASSEVPIQLLTVHVRRSQNYALTSHSFSPVDPDHSADTTLRQPQSHMIRALSHKTTPFQNKHGTITPLPISRHAEWRDGLPASLLAGCPPRPADLVPPTHSHLLLDLPAAIAADPVPCGSASHTVVAMPAFQWANETLG
jgi:hypothetical protein